MESCSPPVMVPFAATITPVMKLAAEPAGPEIWKTYVPSASVGLFATIVIVAEADLVGSVTEVAVTVTVLPVGMAEGAVYVVAASFAVSVGLNEPQDAPPQLTAHCTWGLAEVSFWMTAAKDAAELTCKDAGIG